jgi:hypothetical protein
LTVHRPPLHHIVRVRGSADLTFLRAGVMDEVVINANQVENSPDSTATALRQTTLPFAIDPVLWRFQVPERWVNDKGETKKNYARLGAAYVRGTAIKIADGPLLKTVPSDAEWGMLARNVIAYQQNRLAMMPAQLDLLDDSHPGELHPVRLMAPGLVAYSPAEDRINRLLADASAAAAAAPIAVPVIVPLDRLRDGVELIRLIGTLPEDGVSSYFIWTPMVTEELLLADHDVFAAVLRLIACLAERGIPVGHLHASYSIAALHDIGVSAVVHHLGWIDKGEPADERRGGLRSCQTYVPGVRHCLRFDAAHDLGRQLDEPAYTQLYCECAFCSGSFAAGEHPLDVLLEDYLVPFKDGRNRRTPTGPAVTLNTWHYLLSRRLEIEAFSAEPAVDVVARDVERAALLTGGRDIHRLRRLANELRSA